MNPLLILTVLLAVVGFVWKRSGKAAAVANQIEKLFFSYYLPLAIFWLLASRHIDIYETLHDAGLYYLAIVTFLVLAAALFKKFTLPANTSSLALTVTFVNLVLVGIPVFSILERTNILNLVFLLIPLHAIVLLVSSSLINLVFSREGGRLKGLVNIPTIVWAIVAGAIFSQLSNGYLAQYEVVKSTVSSLTQWLAFLVLGLTLAKCRLDQKEWQLVALMSTAKLLVMPVFVFGFAWLFDPALAPALAIIAGLPSGINPMGYAAAFNDNSKLYASSVALVTTVCAVVTLPFWLWVMS